MAQWAQMNKHLQHLSPEMLKEIYPNTFPVELRYLFANWIENHNWETIDVHLAHKWLHELVAMLSAERNPEIVERFKLHQILSNLMVFQQQPMEFVSTVRDILRKEQCFLTQGSVFQQPPMEFVSTVQDILGTEQSFLTQRDLPMHNFTPLQPTYPEHHVNSSPQPSTELCAIDFNSLDRKVLEIQNRHYTFDSNREKQETEKLQGTNDLDQHLDILSQTPYSNTLCTKNHEGLLNEAVTELDQCQARLIQEIQAWKWRQHRSRIGLVFDEKLTVLQTWCEKLFGVLHFLLKEELRWEDRDKLCSLLQTLVQNSLVVETQPPLVIKTQSKFTTTVRFLLGEKMFPGKPVQLMAQIINELHGRNLCQQGVTQSENAGDLVSYTANVEHNASSKSTTATFRNMYIKKIKRADRRGSDSVTEEKLALLFTTEIHMTDCQSPYGIQTMSLPVVVIVHGSQEKNAMATILWDCAFSEPGRMPFVVPERVPWKQMGEALSKKFMCEVQTKRGLDENNLHFLAEKIFGKPEDFPQEFNNMTVSWAQFNKDLLPGRSFTFWQWFEEVLDVTKKYLREYWSENLIFGFIGKHRLHHFLQHKPCGTFLLRFSDSEIGGITIAYIDAGRNVQNVKPFTKKDLESTKLGNTVQDLACLTLLYPDTPKNEAFKKFCEAVTHSRKDGYLPVKTTTIILDAVNGSSTPVMIPSDRSVEIHNLLFNPPSSCMLDPNLVPQEQYPHRNENEEMELETLINLPDLVHFNL